MSLKESIVIRSEYTNNARSKPGGGSRGGSPGQYVMRYMAREDATEVLAPARSGDSEVFDSEVFSRYMARSDATEKMKSKEDDLLTDEDAYGSPLVLKHRFRKMDKLSGRAFGSKGISLSQDDLVDSSKEVQEAFDDGHSVQKIILSFTEEYLKETGVIDPGFKHKGRGSYKGHVDQLKLRQAIIEGVDKMTKVGKFKDPVWVGTIQFDTSYVHSHIALVDKEFSEYRMSSDGADRGKINNRERKAFRKGIHYSLEDMKDLKFYNKQASLERQNVTAFVKDYAYHTLAENTPMQLLIASLPEDKNAWRYKTNRESMKYPNELATGIIEDVFEKDPEGSGYKKAMGSVVDYANESMRKNKLTRKERQDIIQNGRERLVERSVNGLYSTIKEIGPHMFNTRTTMTDIQSSSDEELAGMLNNTEGDFDPASFMLRVRGYNKREEIHSKKTKEFYDLATEYDFASENNLVDSTANIMRLFYEEELRYHMGLSDKYRKFLAFRPDVDRKNIKELSPVYNDLTNRFVAINNNSSEGLPILEDKNQYKKDLRAYTYKCFEKGVGSLKEWDSVVDFDREGERVETNFVLPIKPKSSFENLSENHFKNVKALDVHHLGLDYYNKPDARIDSINTLKFANVFENRSRFINGAKVYMDNTGQNLSVLDSAIDDLGYMESAVEKAIEEGLIESVTIEDTTFTEKRQFYTIPVDHSIDTTKHIRVSIESDQDLEGDVLE